MAHVDESQDSRCTETVNPAGGELETTSAKILTLPPEIRNHIYSELLPTDEIWHISGAIYYELHLSSSSPEKKSYIKNDETQSSEPKNRLAITRTCKQIRSETLRYFYGFNAFVLPIAPDEFEKTAKWLAFLPAEAYSVLRKVYFQQNMRRCHRNRLPWYERLLGIDLKTLEIEIIGKLRHCTGCLNRYAGQIERARERSSFKELKEVWDDDDLSLEKLMRLALLFQRRTSVAKVEEEGDEDSEYFAGLVRLFGDV